jgi:hypothetical protein
MIISGGDTVVIRGCAALSGQQNPDNPHCRVGEDNSNHTGIFCQGVSAFWGCSMPPPPSGNASNHTRILGACAFGTYTCTPVIGYPYTSNNLTQLYSGWSAGGLMFLNGASYIDIEGLELTTHNGACSTLGCGSPKLDPGSIYVASSLIQPMYASYAETVYRPGRL